MKLKSLRTVNGKEHAQRRTSECNITRTEMDTRSVRCRKEEKGRKEEEKATRRMMKWKVQSQ